MRKRLTGILHCGYDHLETVRVRSPAVGDVFQCHEIRPRVDGTHALLRVPASEIRLKGWRRERDDEMQMSGSLLNWTLRDDFIKFIY